MMLEDFLKRREKFFAALPKNSVAIVFAAEEVLRNGDGYYKFRQNSNFYYLTGFLESNSVAVFSVTDSGNEFILFNRGRDREREQWEGFRLGPEGAVSVLRADQAFDIQHIDSIMPDILSGKEAIFYSLGKNPHWDQKIHHWLDILQPKQRQGIGLPHCFSQLDELVHEMRLVKDSYEIKLMQKAADISAQAHLKAMQTCKSFSFEYQLEAELLHEFYRQGCGYYAYPCIVGSGRNACILHYQENHAPLRQGELVLIDAGGEYELYASDITRTFPINGVFSKPQAEIYELVLTAQLAGIAEIRPGNCFEQIQAKIVSVLTQGLIDLGLLVGDLKDLIAQKAYTKYYMHNSGHWLGLDTHDVGHYKPSGQSRILEPGMVLTVEPGLYFLDDLADIPEIYKNIGIRIEDDILVTDHGHQVLSDAAPKTIADIESVMR